MFLHVCKSAVVLVEGVYIILGRTSYPGITCRVLDITHRLLHMSWTRSFSLLQEAAVAAVSGKDVTEPQAEGMLTGSQGFGGTSGLPGSQATGHEESEVARFGAAKEKKHSLENGITVFNRCCCHQSSIPKLSDERHAGT